MKWGSGDGVLLFDDDERYWLMRMTSCHFSYTCAGFLGRPVVIAGRN